MNLRFVKMHGLGNDYVYLDALSRPDLASRRDLPDLARAISNRHTGVGSDGLILLCPPDSASHADVRMRMFNADGSEAQMCGNGVRCVAKFAHDRLGIRPQPARPMRVQTGAGLLDIRYRTDAASEHLIEATVDMGEPITDLARVPVDARHLHATHTPEHALDVRGQSLRAVLVSMGNPHAVFFDQSLPLDTLGTHIEHHPAFPQRINAHDVRILSKSHAAMKTWERGSGLTQACGTGACAVLVAGVLTGRLDRAASLDLPGGTLQIRWDGRSNHVFMTGPAVEVFEGVWPTTVA